MKKLLFCLFPVLLLLAFPVFYGCSDQMSNESAEEQVARDRAAHPEDYAPDEGEGDADEEADEE